MLGEERQPGLVERCRYPFVYGAQPRDRREQSKRTAICGEEEFAIGDGDLIRVRILSAGRPLPDASEVTPTLEDSYLWLLEQRA